MSGDYTHTSVQNNSRTSVNFRPFHDHDRAITCMVGPTVRSYL